MLNLSKFFKSIQIEENVYAVFNSLLMKVLYVDTIELNDIINLKHNNTTLLKEYGIYTTDSFKDDTALKLIKQVQKDESKKVCVLYFILSTGCNLKCKYCFVENNEFNNHCEINMSKDIAIEAANKYIEYLKCNDIYEPQVIFYGGEPFVNYPVMKDVVSCFKNSGLKINLSLVTNGTLLDDEKIKFLKENNFHIGISIDGPKNINDENRIYRETNNSVYDTVIETIDKVEKAEIPYCLSITISKTLVENKDVYFDWIKTLTTKEIFYNLYHYGYGEDSSDWENFYEDMCQFIIESYEILTPLGIKDGRLERKIDSFLNSNFKFADCATIGANQLTIKPNGDVAICHGYCKTDKNTLGNIKDYSIFDLINNNKSDVWMNLSPICRKECIDCEALYICGGGCAVQAENLFGGIEQIDKCYCIHSKDSLKWLLKKLYISSLNEKEENLC